MNIICWILGHKENKDINYIDFIFRRTKDAVYRGKKRGEVHIDYQLRYCDRCKHLHLEKEIKEDLK